MTFDPTAPLPGAPDPWVGSSMPPLREAPPYLMTDMIAAEPALAERIATRVRGQDAMAGVAERIRAAVAAGEAIVTTGCGTSEHAAMVIAAMLEDALGPGGPRISALQAFELARRPPSSGVVLAVSHEGGTDATNAAMAAAGAAGATTGLVTVSDRSPGAALAEWVVTTVEQDQSWCHTVGYLSPLVAGTVLAARVAGEEVDPVALRALLDAADDAATAEEIAERLKRCSRILVIGSGVDYVAARELALKLEEGPRMAANAHQLETLRHGHLAAADDTTGLVLILADGEARGAELLDRATSALRAAITLGMPVAALVAADLGDDLPDELTPAGRLATPLTSRLPRLTAAALGAAIPLQLLTERLARARGVNPDPIGRDDPRQAAAAEQ